MSKETLSVKQADSIIREINDITKETRNKIELTSEEFLTDISHVWEDENAVKFSNNFRESMVKVVDNLSQNNNKFCETVKDIANAYVKAGNMGQSVSSIASKLAIQINSGIVKDHFADGENGDDFGFVNPETGPDQVIDSFNTLKTNLKSIAVETNNRIKAINAFGNDQVKLALASSAAGMIGIVEKQIISSSKSCKELVDESAKRYIQVGQSAASGASIGGEGSSGGSTGGSGGGSGSSDGSGEASTIEGRGEEMPVVKYGPPTPTPPQPQPQPMPEVKYGPPTPIPPIKPEPQMPVVKYGPPTPQPDITPAPMPVVKYGPPTPQPDITPAPMPVVKYGPPTPTPIYHKNKK